MRRKPRPVDWPTVDCPTCGQTMRPNNLARHTLAKHGDPRESTIVPLETQERIVFLYGASHSSMAKVAAQVYVSESTVRKVLHAWGVETAGRKDYGPRVSTDELLRTSQMYGRGLTLAQVGDVLGIAQEAVRQRLIANGTPRRRRGPRPGRSTAGSTL